MGEEKAKKKIEDLGNSIVQEIRSGKNPRFVASSRTRSNIIYDKKNGYLRLGPAKEERTFINVAQAKKFMQTVAIAAKCHSFLEQNLHTAIRGLFYQLKYTLGEDVDENIFSEQAESNPLIEDLEVALGLKREELNLYAQRKGVLAGNMRIIDTFGEREGRDRLQQDGEERVGHTERRRQRDRVRGHQGEVRARGREGRVWQRLNEDRFWKKENCILITPGGQAARGTRRLIRKLADRGLPVYVFTDSDAWGWYIYWTIKTGSINLAYIGGDVATPEARFIGVTLADLDKYDFLNKLTINATDVDMKRAQEMLSYEWIRQHKEWVVELERMIKNKKKLEQDALQGRKLTFIGDYIRDKVKNKDFLP